MLTSRMVVADPSQISFPHCLVYPELRREPRRERGSERTRKALRAHCVSAFSSLSLSSFHNLQTFQHSTLSPVISRRMRTYAKHTPNPFRMSSFKTQDLKPFRMCSSRKKGVGERSSSTSYPIELGVFICRSPGRRGFCRDAGRCASHDRSPPGRSR